MSTATGLSLLATQNQAGVRECGVLVCDRVEVDVDHHFHALGTVRLVVNNARPAALEAADTHDADETIFGVYRR